MKIKTILFLATCAAMFSASACFGAISVTFSGGGGTPLSITLPAISWEITDAAGFNSSDVFGIGIAVGQVPDLSTEGNAIGGNNADWSSDGTTTFPGVTTSAFASNNNLGGANNGGIVWLGMDSSQTAVDGETITYAGGTFGNNANVATTFSDGLYDVYLLSFATIQPVTTPGVAVPEPATYAALAGLGALAVVAVRRRKRSRS